MGVRSPAAEADDGEKTPQPGDRAAPTPDPKNKTTRALHKYPLDKSLMRWRPWRERQITSGFTLQQFTVILGSLGYPSGPSGNGLENGFDAGVDHTRFH